MRAIVTHHLAWLARAKGTLAAVLLTALTVALAGLLALHDAGDRALAASAILWILVALAGLTATTRVLAAEEGDGGLQALLLAPLDRRDLFAARALAGAPLVLGLGLLGWALLIPFFPSLAHLTGPGPLVPLILGSLGLTVLGTFAGWAALSSQAGQLIGPALALPLAAPLIIACLHATQEALLQGPGWGPSLTFALGYDLAVGALTYLLAGQILEVGP